MGFLGLLLIRGATAASNLILKSSEEIFFRLWEKNYVILIARGNVLSHLRRFSLKTRYMGKKKEETDRLAHTTIKLQRIVSSVRECAVDHVKHQNVSC